MAKRHYCYYCGKLIRPGSKKKVSLRWNNSPTLFCNDTCYKGYCSARITEDTTERLKNAPTNTIGHIPYSEYCESPSELSFEEAARLLPSIDPHAFLKGEDEGSTL